MKKKKYRDLNKTSIEEEVLQVCNKLFWPVYVLWCIVFVIKIVVMITEVM